MKASSSLVARRGDFRAAVLYNRRIGARNYRIAVRLPVDAEAAFSGFQPGQFVEVSLSGTALPAPAAIPADLVDKADRQVLLRRPFSLSNLVQGPEGLVAELTYCVLGPATLRMTTLREGDSLQVLGPLGRGFDVPEGQRWAILVAGGMGAPPIQHLARILTRDHLSIRPIGFAGAKTADALPFEASQSDPRSPCLAALGLEWHVATDDGSWGHRGFVTQCLQTWLASHPQQDRGATGIYACGPEPMLAKVAQIAQAHGIACQVSMERRMACGFGVCQGCAVQCRSDDAPPSYRLCCQDGPVFDAEDVVFET